LESDPEFIRQVEALDGAIEKHDRIRDVLRAENHTIEKKR
jgi:hypothetical protein